jgi:hypothetical protein
MNAGDGSGDQTAMTLRGRALDWAWAHPRWKKRAREVWATGRGVARRLHLGRLLEPEEFRDLRRLAATATPPLDGGPRLLILSFRGWSTHLSIEAVLGHTVVGRGWVPVFVTCGGRLPVCDVMPVQAAPPMPCRSCSEYATGAIGAAGFDVVKLRDIVEMRSVSADARRRVADLSSVDECGRFAASGLPLGRLVRTSVAWFLSRGTLTEDPVVLRTYRSFLVSGLVLAEAFDRILDRVRPDRLLVLNGRFFAEAIITAMASQRGLGWTAYERGFRPDTIVATPDAPACDLIIPEDGARRALERPLTAAEDGELEAYLSERRDGQGTFDKLWTVRIEDPGMIRSQLTLTDARPLVVMFPNILWDSAVVGMDLGFASVGDWVVGGIRWARTHPELDLVVRLHPAEVRLTNHPTVERMSDHIRREVPALPPNVRIVAPESPISSYSLIDAARVGLVYTSTVGLEMAARGIPVVVGARTHYRGLGFTIDPTTPDEYWAAVDRLVGSTVPGEVDRMTRLLARRYAHAFFFSFHRRLGGVHEEGHSRPRVLVRSAADLEAGRDPSLDLIVSDVLGTAPRFATRRAGA